ncbi:hypothetical protein GCM10022225_61030 [Plantactinospora mayteni]|uniref:Uncharacterized protein n=1 Tax=Plantactinospora mayteni TaxID=566021 RepID=A0ABQ4EZS5_9ACTN|nr:hypothetical protein [Plantactinospora mayteni]GIH00155.1 hypothetical protein Pma05_67270 [Plantactinospora mayteni]
MRSRPNPGRPKLFAGATHRRPTGPVGRSAPEFVGERVVVIFRVGDPGGLAGGLREPPPQDCPFRYAADQFV